MKINAFEKITNEIYERLSNFNEITCRNVEDAKERSYIIDNATGYGGYKEWMVNDFKTSVVKERIYDNGFIFLDSNISYIEKGNAKNIRQLTLTTDYNKAPIVNIVIEEDKKSIQNFLTSVNVALSSEANLPDRMKIIGVQKASFHINEECGSVFETYKNLIDNSLLVEKYMQYYPVSNFENKYNDLLNLCGCGSRYLEIIYENELPIYAQLSDKYSVEMAGFNPNSISSVGKIVDIVNVEVETIITKINNEIDKNIKCQSKSLSKNN